MTVVSIDKYFKGRGRKIIRFDDGTQIVLYPGELKRVSLELDDEVDGEIWESIINEILTPRAKKRALHLLEKQDRTESDIRKKLSMDYYPDCVVDTAIAYLYSYHYLDDERYAKNYIHYSATGKSKRLVRQSLMNKGVPKDLVESVLEDEYDTDERVLIRRELDKKHYDASTADEAAKRRVYSYLLRRGFAISDIMAVMRLDDN